MYRTLLLLYVCGVSPVVLAQQQRYGRFPMEDRPHLNWPPPVGLEPAAHAFPAGNCDREARYPAIVPRIHAHNDYQHPHPLWGSLHAGIRQLEVDVYERDGKLLVAHLPWQIRRGRTLEALYLEPLMLWLDSTAGRPFLDDSVAQLMLVLDLKTSGPATRAALQNTLFWYQELFLRREEWAEGAEGAATTSRPPAVRLCVSGKPLFATDAEWAEYNKPCGSSEHNSLGAGGLYLYYKTFPVLVYRDAQELVQEPQYRGDPCPVDYTMLSLKWNDWLQWTGHGVCPARDSLLLCALAAGYGNLDISLPLRLYGAPDCPAVWQTLINCSVPIINTDRPAQLAQWLVQRFSLPYPNPCMPAENPPSDE